MTTFIRRLRLRGLEGFGDRRASTMGSRSIETHIYTKTGLATLLVLVAAVLVCNAATARAQSASILVSPESTADEATPPDARNDGSYMRPTQRTMVRNYAFDAFGPYPLVGAAITAGVHQASNAPPEWKQDFHGYARRYGSDFGIAAVATTTRYGLAEAFKQDTMYYRCECSGVFPRARHALVSTLTARRGRDGHTVFSIPALVAPYAGSMTAVYGWYPDRFGAKDGFRLGNYSLLLYAGGNLALEFLYSGPHSMLAHMHLNNAHGSPVEGPNK